MVQKKSIQQLEFTFNSKSQFEHEILTCSLGLHPNALIGEDFKIIKNVLLNVESSNSMDPNIIRKIKLNISTQIFRKQVSDLSKLIEDHIFNKIDVLAENNLKVEYLNEQLGKLYDVSRKIIFILNEYPNTNDNILLEFDIKGMFDEDILPPLQPILLIEDFIKWGFNYGKKLSEFDEKIGIDFINKINEDKILETCLIKSYYDLRDLSQSIIYSHKNLLSYQKLIVKDIEFIAGIEKKFAEDWEINTKSDHLGQGVNSKTEIINDDSFSAEKHLYFMRNRNYRNNKLIMEESEYIRMIEYTDYFFSSNELPTKIKKLKKLNITNGEIAYTFIKMYDEAYPKPPRSFVFFKFLNDVFEQLHNADFCKENYRSKSIYKKGAIEPIDYNKLING